MLLSVIGFSDAFAEQLTGFEQFYQQPYAIVRQALLGDGWQIVSNPKIQDSSMVAQGIYDHQYQEVLDCISMERDQCQFILSKDGEMMLVTTKEKDLNVELIQFVSE